MNKIVSSEYIAPGIKKLVVEEPIIAKKRKPGQFIILHAHEKSERIPLTIVDSDPKEGTITLMIQEIGKSTKEINRMQAGDQLRDILGPLGKPSHIEKFGTAVVIGGGVGTAVVYPTAKAIKEAGNHTISIIGGRSKDLIILEDELKAFSDEVYATTDDGSYGYHGFVTQKLQDMIDFGRKIDFVLAIGPLPMMRAVAEVTRPYGIKTVVSLNTIMVDGTGMCGGCRATVGDEIVFVCVDGPEFDAHLVDFDEIIMRNRSYISEEKSAIETASNGSKKITVKERMKIPRQPMPMQDPIERAKNFEEVALGYTEEQAILEATRCIQCKKPSCIEGCPVRVQIPSFIAKVAEGDFREAARLIKEDNVLAAVTGRVCPQSDQCEAECVLGRKGDSVAIGRLERFVADYERKIGSAPAPYHGKKSGKRVAVAGAGPAGLTVAGDLIRQGHEVTVFDAFHEFGGVLVYGIPEFRLPKQIVKEQIEGLKALGVIFQANKIIGNTFTVDELMEEGFDAVFLGVGAGLPNFLNIPGENYVGVYSSNEFLTRVNLMKAYDFPNYDTPIYNCKDKVVAVFGGGNTAMDSVRVAKRLGAKEAYIIYRRTEEAMPAREEEIEHGMEEGIKFLFLSSPKEFFGDEDGRLTGVKIQKMELGEPDASGRRRPIPIPDSEYILDIETAIVAVGNGSNPLIQQTTPDLSFNKWGNILVNEETMQTEKKGVYAGGDIVTGGATVILAMGAGRKAAKAINEYLETL
ncbi:MAG: bifunctional dihydroorotate dehydrogenase B NAD binding subunit/NADPH-dependent glutamate synthase [Anaerolineaceae bacterium]|nr:bifunctional dihydroorotate dehydrogenase B NAD binding subunit/NADPH-dependent glutamate synthase [Anaerolineaceae bacterium]